MVRAAANDVDKKEVRRGCRSIGAAQGREICLNGLLFRVIVNLRHLVTATVAETTPISSVSNFRYGNAARSPTLQSSTSDVVAMALQAEASCPPTYLDLEFRSRIL